MFQKNEMKTKIDPKENNKEKTMFLQSFEIDIKYLDGLQELSKRFRLSFSNPRTSSLS